MTDQNVRNVPRAERVDELDFITGYFQGCKAGLTGQELADELGMKLGSMVTRASKYRAEAAAIGKIFPSPAGGDSKAEKRRKKIALMTSLLADFDDDESADSVE